MTSLTLFLVRHGETYDNARLVPPSGSHETDLSPVGVEQANALSAEMKKLLRGRAPRLYCSDEKRARATLEPTRKLLAIPSAAVVYDVEYREFYRGDPGFETSGRTAWLAEYERQKLSWTSAGGDPDDFKLPGGTSANEEMRHTARVARGLNRRHSGECVVLMAHGGFNGMMLRGLVGTSVALPQENACINVLTLDERGRLIEENVLLNYTEYLPDDLRPWGPRATSR